MVAVTTAIDVGVARPVTAAGGTTGGAAFDALPEQPHSAALRIKLEIWAAERAYGAKRDVMNLSWENLRATEDQSSALPYQRHETVVLKAAAARGPTAHGNWKLRHMQLHHIMRVNDSTSVALVDLPHSCRP